MSDQPPKDAETIWIDCPKCGMPIPKGSDVCGHCGTKFRDAPPPPPQEEDPRKETPPSDTTSKSQDSPHCDAPKANVHCPNCGKESIADGNFCPHCGVTLKPENMPYINTHLVKSILSTTFFCLPFGVVAICFSAIATGRLFVGDRRGAQEAAYVANDWANLAILTGITAALVCLWYFFGLDVLAIPFGIAAVHLLLSFLSALRRVPNPSKYT